MLSGPGALFSCSCAMACCISSSSIGLFSACSDPHACSFVGVEDCSTCFFIICQDPVHMGSYSQLINVKQNIHIFYIQIISCPAFEWGSVVNL